jgi:hypothetical protein
VPTDHCPWERLVGEPLAAFHAFCHYRDGALTGTSVDRAWREHQTTCVQKGINQVSDRRRPTSWGRWSSAWDWPGRRDAYLRFLDDERRRKFLKEQQDATARHLRMVVAGQQALAMQLKATLEATQPPTASAELKASYVGGAGLQRALADGREACRLIPSIVATERLILGLSTAIDEFREERRPGDAIADAIAADPELASDAVDWFYRATLAAKKRDEPR